MTEQRTLPAARAEAADRAAVAHRPARGGTPWTEFWGDDVPAADATTDSSIQDIVEQVNDVEVDDFIQGHRSERQGE